MKLLHRAPYVVPVVQPPIEDGAVLVEDDRILAIGSYSDLRGQGTLIDHEGKALTPAMINAHVHLELSHLAELGRGAHEGDITDWISKLLAMRREGGGDPLDEARNALRGLHESGVALMADIGNQVQSGEIGVESSVEVLFFLEMLGLSRAAADSGLSRLHDLENDCTGHAPYSTNSRLLTGLKQRAVSRGSLFPLHVAESPAEMEFLAHGTGPLRSFVEEKGLWDGSFMPPGCGSVEYLDRLGILDERTLCVHCVHVADEELQILAARGSQVCLCPGSNRFLGVGRAPVGKMLKAGLFPCLGTDSPASNPVLSMWEEMRLLRLDHPGLHPEHVFAMATLSGARALQSADFGELSPGRSARFIAVDIENAGNELYEYLTVAGTDIAVHWAHEVLTA